MSKDITRCGFVALIGAPNAGKSTITNNFVGSKVSIVSPKVQTTRTLVKGIGIYTYVYRRAFLSRGAHQILSVLTPAHQRL